MTNKNKETLWGLKMTQRTFTLWKESSLFLFSFISHSCYPLALPCSLVCTRWPCAGLLGAQQCFSLARGVCTLTSLKIPEDRFRTRVSDRLPWKDLGQTSQNKTTRKVQQHYRTHPSFSQLECTIGKEHLTQRKKEHRYSIGSRTNSL